MKPFIKHLRNIGVNAEFITIAILVIISGLAKHSYVQDSAKSWFEKGQVATDELSKKQYFIKAIESDSNFVPAYYRLGEVLVSSNQLQLAENVFKLGLLKAQETSDLTGEAQITIELATIARNRRDHENAIKYLSQAEKLQITPELQAIIKYDLGTIYMFQSKFAEATQYFETGQKLAPKLKSKFDHALALARSEGKIEIWYRKAETFFQQNQWNQALELYQKIALISIDYKDVDLKLRLLKQKFQLPKNESELDEIYARGITQLLKKDYKNAIDAFEMIIKIAPGFKDVQEKLQTARANYIPEQKETDLAERYQQGIDAFNQQQWEDALGYFKQVMVIDSNFQNIHQFIQQTEKNIKRQAKSVIVENPDIMELESVEMKIPVSLTEIDTLQEFRKNYMLGQQFAGQNRWTQALLAFEKAKLYYKDSDSLNQQIDFAKQKLKNKNQSHFDESQFNVVEGRQWDSVWLIGLTILISALIFLLIFRRYLKKTEVRDS
ncbi:tetratricopeptide repeat protein [candidate division KSB1 bacterium]|nr:tetratricopeptide repeat protein [candidate division KSB1 bacterium]